jgi:hypothetical protein
MSFLTKTAIEPGDLREPAIARFLFSSSKAAWLWLVVRHYHRLPVDQRWLGEDH